MKTKSKLMDGEIEGELAALKRAAKAARKLAHVTKTPFWVMKNGRMVDLCSNGRSNRKSKIANQKSETPPPLPSPGVPGEGEAIQRSFDLRSLRELPLVVRAPPRRLAPLDPIPPVPRKRRRARVQLAPAGQL